MLRLHLPPNFTAAVARNAVPIRVELDLKQVPSEDLLPILALLQRWCGTPVPPKFIQLNRAQLRDLVKAAIEQPVFVENGQATTWRYGTALEEKPITPDVSADIAVNDRAGRDAPRKSENRGPKLQNHPTLDRAPSFSGSRLTVDGSEHFLAITLPSRDHPQYDRLVAMLKENGFTLEPSNRKWWLRDRHKTLNFLAGHLGELQERYGAELSENFEKNAAKITQAEITADIGTTGGGFEVSLGVDAGATSESDVRSAIASNRGYVESNGKVYLLDSERLQQLAVAQRALAGDPNAGVAPRRTVTVSAARSAEVQDILEQISPNFQAPDAWRERSAALRNLTSLVPAPISGILDSQLRPYQRLGVAWLWHLQRHDLGGILADEMGLGKTLQALALLSAVTRGVPNASDNPVRFVRGSSPVSAEIDGGGGTSSATGNFRHPKNQKPSPCLVICPASLLENWRREASRFTPDLRVFVHHSNQRLTAPADFSSYQLIITSYGTLTRDQALFAAVEFACVIADEAQHIKNRRSQNAAALRALQAKSRFVLTGTPVENALDDLRSLFEFLLPGYLTRVPSGLRGDEKAWYDDRLRAQTAPYILRRTKKSVAPELPDKIEQVIWCELTATQSTLYRQTQERSERELMDMAASGAGEGKLKFAALTQLLRLRQICCDPRLIGRADLDGVAPSAPESKPTTDHRPPEAISGANANPQSPKSKFIPFADSAKLDAFRELLEEAVDDGHRVLVFSQFTSLLALLREELDAVETPYCYLDGSMPARARQAQIDRFQESSDIPLFLLSLKAGGTGLNLTGADTVVHFDPWWNPAAEAQATDRAHRIGQTRTVTSYKLIAAGTVEEKVLALQAQKRALLADVFEASDAAAAKLSLADLRELLRT
jgi:superfamily II DNA or RNA helicase